MLLIGPLGTNFSEIHAFSFKKMHFKISKVNGLLPIWYQAIIGAHFLSAEPLATKFKEILIKM